MKLRFISTIILLAYIAILIKFMVFKDLPIIRIGAMRLNLGGTHEGAPNLIPFKTIFLYMRGQMGLFMALINLIGNIILPFPIGFLVAFDFPKLTWKKCLAIAIATGLLIETLQAVLHVGIFDVDDIILNALGVMLGYRGFRALLKVTRSMKTKNIIITVVIIVVAGVGAYFYAINVLKNHFSESNVHIPKHRQ